MSWFAFTFKTSASLNVENVDTESFQLSCKSFLQYSYMLHGSNTTSMRSREKCKNKDVIRQIFQKMESIFTFYQRWKWKSLLFQNEYIYIDPTVKVKVFIVSEWEKLYCTNGESESPYCFKISIFILFQQWKWKSLLFQNEHIHIVPTVGMVMLVATEGEVRIMMLWWWWCKGDDDDAMMMMMAHSIAALRRLTEGVTAIQFGTI